MRYLLFFCLAFCFSVVVSAQNVSVRPTRDTLKVFLSKEAGLSAIYKNQPVAVSTKQALDSLLKKIPIEANLQVVFESVGMEPEKNREINTVLKQCKCEIIAKSTSMARHD